MARIFTFPAAVAIAIALGGCSGGRTGGSEPALPSAALPVSNSAPQSATAQATLRITIPGAAIVSASRRRPAYVSPATNSLTFSQNGGTPQTLSLAPSSPNCASAAGGRTCSVSVDATPGSNQTFLLKTFASSDGSGTPLSAQQLVATIEAGKTNPISAVLGGVIAMLSVSLDSDTLEYGKRGSTNVVVNALDASGNTIVGPGAFADANGNPLLVTLSDDDSTGSTKLGSTTLYRASAVVLSYDGGGVASVRVAAKAGAIAASATLQLICGKPSSTLALYAGGQLTEETVGFGELALSASGPNVTSHDRVEVSPADLLNVDSRGFTYAQHFKSATNESQTYESDIYQYCPGALGTEVPYRSYVMPTPAPGNLAYYETVIAGIGTDAAYDLIALLVDVDTNHVSIVRFAKDAGAIGAPKAGPSPVAVISGSNTGLDGSTPGFAVDPSGNTYVAGAASISKFAARSTGNVVPESKLSDTAGGLIGIIDVKADGDGNVFVLYQHDNLRQQPASAPLGPLALVEYRHGVYTTPARIISGSATQLGTYAGTASSATSAESIALDDSGNAYVMNFRASNPMNTAIEKFAPDENGNVAPESTMDLDGNESTIAISGSGAFAANEGVGVNLYTASGVLEGSISAVGKGPSIVSLAYDPSGDLYTLEIGAGIFPFFTVYKYAAPLKPGESPSDTIALDHTPDGLAGLLVDSAGTLYASTSNGVDVFSDFGHLMRSFSDARENLDPASGLVTFDRAGYAYFVLEDQHAVDAISARATGAVEPEATYDDVRATTLGARLAVDGNGTRYVASCTTNSIGVYTAQQTSGPPERAIVGPKTLLDCPSSIAVDPSGTIYVANATNGTYSEDDLASAGTVLVFTSAQNGNVAPARSISPVPGEIFTGLAIGPGYEAP